MKQNLVVLLADLFNLFEIHPAKCVCYPGMDNQGELFCVVKKSIYKYEIGDGFFGGIKLIFICYFA